ncbi:MAG: circadian clock KaiB family protein [Anaerolineae bacterium]|nr:circadian clock KaiB family protein [Anaerolineae bacterium]MDW8173980.1 circadian clock KaiB family protein [Anaerolineae bacterium]
MSAYILSLYVAGATPKSELIIARVRALCAQAFGSDFQLNVIDVIQQPDVAEEQRILATPTLVREHPAPRRYIIGDLSHVEKVVQALEMPTSLSSNNNQGSTLTTEEEQPYDGE